MISTNYSQKLVFILVFLCIAPQAYAYIDPGTGSLILQGLLAAIAGAMVTAKFYWHRIMTFFGFRKDHEGDDQGENDKPESE